jgi:hypothetical protein
MLFFYIFSFFTGQLCAKYPKYFVLNHDLFAPKNGNEKQICLRRTGLSMGVLPGTGHGLVLPDSGMGLCYRCPGMNWFYMSLNMGWCYLSLSMGLC